MSAAATAAGYLYAHGRLSAGGPDRQVDAERPHHAAEAQPSRRLEPKTVLWQGQSQPLKQVRTPRIEYRKRRPYALPSAA
jgi:hypothetical protein